MSNDILYIVGCIIGMAGSPDTKVADFEANDALCYE
jgi:hypothetical protein